MTNFYSDENTDDDFKTEGFAMFIDILMNDLYDEVPGNAHKSMLLTQSFRNNPYDPDSTYYDYVIGGRFLYYVYQTYRDKADVTAFFRTICSSLSIEDSIKEITGKELKDVFREFFLSAFSGMGVDFGPDVIPFEHSADIHFTLAGLHESLNSMYAFKDVYDDGFSPYRDSESPIIVERLPESSFVLSLWDMENVTEFTYVSDSPEVETWLFALPISGLER